MSKDSINEKNEFECVEIASAVTFAPYKISLSFPSKISLPAPYKISLLVLFVIKSF